MAIIHQATVTPSKLELLATFLPSRVRLVEHVGEGLEIVGAYRFDDPAGEVGIETHILTSAGGPFLQIPVTYRSAPLAGADRSLIGTMEHSVLGQRWMYDATAEPVYVGELLRTILTGGMEAPEIVETPDGPQPRATKAQVRGSGSSDDALVEIGDHNVEQSGTTTRISSGDLTLVVPHVLADDDPLQWPHGLRLSGMWAGRWQATTLAWLEA